MPSIPRPWARRKGPAPGVGGRPRRHRTLRRGSVPACWTGHGRANPTGARARPRDRTIDITTTGRASGQARRVQIWFHNLDGRLYITGPPGSRDWYANLCAHPEFTFHLKESVRADLPARATPVLAPERRRTILARLLRDLGHAGELETWVRESPLVEVEILERE